MLMPARILRPEQTAPSASKSALYPNIGRIGRITRVGAKFSRYAGREIADQHTGFGETDSRLARQTGPASMRHSAHAAPGTRDDAAAQDRGKIYAWPGCGSYDTMAPQNRVVFPSRDAAKQAGYRTAYNCP